MSVFDRDYYEDGLRKGISGYENYRWMPTRSIPEAIEIRKCFDFNTCVDYGCAKGFLVHALRLLGCDAYGEDISEYALDSSMHEVKPYLSLPNEKRYDLLLCKDVLEHVDESNLEDLLYSLKKKSNKHFYTIPLGDDDRFRIREYEVDVTHVTKKDEEWWLNLFYSCGFKLIDFSYSFGSIKNKWVSQYPYGNGFFTLEVL